MKEKVLLIFSNITKATKFITIILNIPWYKSLHHSPFLVHHGGKEDLLEEDVTLLIGILYRGVVHMIDLEEVEHLLAVAMYEIEVRAPQKCPYCRMP